MSSDSNLENIFAVSEVLRILVRRKFLIIFTTIIGLFLSSVYALSIDNKYESKAVLAPVEAQNNINRSISTYSGIASIAGINLGSPISGRSNESIEVLQSFKFFKEHILLNINIFDLMAVESWEPVTQKLIYDPKVYILDKNFWVQPKPTNQETYLEFKKHFSIYVNKENGFITLSIAHRSPFIAQEWLNKIIFEIDNLYRVSDKESSLRTIDYINIEIQKTSYKEIQEALSRIIEQEVKKLALIESSQDYIFKVIEPGFVPEKKISPNRLLLVSIGVIFGMLGGVLVALSSAFLQNNSNKE